MFSQNGKKGPESKKTRIFCPARKVAVAGRSMPSPTASCFVRDVNLHYEVTRYRCNAGQSVRWTGRGERIEAMLQIL